MTWTEIETRHGLYRYRRRNEQGAFEVEYWHAGCQEWRHCANVSSRDWFAIGFQAGRESVAREVSGFEDPAQGRLFA